MELSDSGYEGAFESWRGFMRPPLAVLDALSFSYSIDCGQDRIDIALAVDEWKDAMFLLWNKCFWRSVLWVSVFLCT